jgi:uncharacterized protein YchJ
MSIVAHCGSKLHSHCMSFASSQPTAIKEGDLLCDRVPAYILQGVVFVGDDWCQGCYAASILERGVSLTCLRSLGARVAHIADEEAAEEDAEIQEGESDTLWPVGVLRFVEFVDILARNIVAVFLL